MPPSLSPSLSFTMSFNLFPSEEFELTANSLGVHVESHGKIILRTLSYLTVNSQDELTL